MGCNTDLCKLLQILFVFFFQESVYNGITKFVWQISDIYTLKGLTLLDLKLHIIVRALNEYGCGLFWQISNELYFVEKAFKSYKSATDGFHGEYMSKLQALSMNYTCKISSLRLGSSLPSVSKYFTTFKKWHLSSHYKQRQLLKTLTQNTDRNHPITPNKSQTCCPLHILMPCHRATRDLCVE